jgi:hypothetical protein
VAAIRETHQAEDVFGGSGIEYLQAPAKHRNTADRYEPPVTYAQLLHNVGLGDARELTGLLASWDTLVRLVEPVLVVCEHSPTTLLALRGSAPAKVVYGLGFYCPPDTEPLVKVRPWEPLAESQAFEQERRLLTNVNRVLENRGQPPIERLSKLFYEVDEQVYVTFPELDHFGVRDGVTYWGGLPSGAGGAENWPRGRNPKVLAYLKNFPGVDECLFMLAQTGLSTVAICPDAPDAWLERLAGSSVQVRRQPADLERLARECDFAVTHASHGMTASLLLAGKPLLQLPIFVEQYLIAERVKQMGAGLICPTGNAGAFQQVLEAMLHRPALAVAAREFAIRHEGHQPANLAARIADRLEAHLGRDGILVDSRRK